ncbi:hypothetical protein ACFL2B_03335 [Patescibacteria group bacterium]
MSKKKKRKKNHDHAPLDKYGASIATALAVGATVWAVFRVGFKIQDGVKKIRTKK